MTSIQKRNVHTAQRVIAIRTARDNGRDEPNLDDWRHAKRVTEYSYAVACGWRRGPLAS
jgi:hypothetical protein